MSGTPRTTLNPGDLVEWVEEDIETALLAVTEDGQRFQFQFARQAWDEMTFKNGEHGLTVPQAEAVLRGEAEFPLPGYIFKCYDEATGQSFPDPKLEESL